MSQSLSQIYVHLIFHIKTTSPTIHPDDLHGLYAYITGVITHLGERVICVGGTNNHVHILCTLPKQLALCSYVEKIKISSNKYLKSLSRRYMDFYWQGGYGAFSVSASRTSIVKDYIENQQTHHHKKTFQEEYREFLQQYRIEYNDKFVFRD